MNRARPSVVTAILAVLGGMLVAGQPAQAEPAVAACDYPAQILNLTNWKITLPIDDPNQSGTQPLEVKQPALNTYRINPWFVVNSACDGVQFRNAVTGAHTPNSTYARSELREMTNNGSANASWSSTSGTHTMIVDQAITHLPNDKPHVVAGQIHDSSDDVSVFRLEGSNLYVTDGDNTHYKLVTSNYVLGTRFQAKFVVSGGQIKAYYNGVLQTTLSKSFSGGYFKAGAYTQANCTNSAPCSDSNFGQVIVYNVTVDHGTGSGGSPLPVSAVTASGHDGNVPENTLDNNLSTRWSAEGDGVWIRYDLGSARTVGSVALAWHRGDQRRSHFQIQTSTDGSSWTTVADRDSGGTTLQPETYDIPDGSARYVRVVGNGNTENEWTSITETDIYDPQPAGGPSIPIDAGLRRDLVPPDPVTGSTLDIRDFGATANNSADDDGAAIRRAIAAARAGDEVYLPNGTFHIKQRRIDLKSGVSVRGQSRDGAVLLAELTSTSDGKDAWIIGAEPGTTNLTLSGFTVTSNGSTSGTSGMNYGIWLGRGDSTCTTIECDRATPAVSRIRVADINLQKFIKMGMNVRNGHDILIEGNRVHSALADGGGGQGYGVMLGYGQTEHTVVRDNLIEAGSGKMRHGILLQFRAHHNLVERNTVRDHNEDLIDLHGEQESNNEIRNNTVSGSARACFGVGNTGGTTEHGPSGPNNWIHHNSGSGCRAGLHLIQGSHDQVIEDNHLHDNAEFGLQLYNGSGNNLRIRGNRLTGNPVGIRIEESAGTLIECNDVTNNSSESLRLTGSVTSYTIRHNDFRDAEVTLDNDAGSYTANCEDANGITDCLGPCGPRP